MSSHIFCEGGTGPSVHKLSPDRARPPQKCFTHALCYEGHELLQCIEVQLIRSQSRAMQRHGEGVDNYGFHTLHSSAFENTVVGSG